MESSSKDRRRTRAPDALDDLPIGVLVFSARGVVRVNDGWVAMTGLTPEESSGEGWLAAVHPEDRAHAESVPNAAYTDGEEAGDWRLVRVGDDGDAIHRWVHARVRHAKTDSDGACVVTLTEIHSHKTNELRLLHLATHDPLTTIPNREAFMDLVGAALAARDGITALLFIDLDRFKQVNDRHGHLTGDKLLVAVARRIRSAVRPLDVVGRLGGDEFAILARDVATVGDATRLAERIVHAVSEPFSIDDEVLVVGASVGIAVASEAIDPLQLVSEADEEMYRAKEAGGGQWSVRGREQENVEHHRALAEAAVVVAQVGLDVTRLHRQVVELQARIVHLGDSALSARIDEICRTLEHAKAATEHQVVL